EARAEVVVRELLLCRRAPINFAADAQDRLAALPDHREYVLSRWIQSHGFEIRRRALEHAHDLIAAITQVYVELREFRVEQWLPFTGLVGRGGDRGDQRECNQTECFFHGAASTRDVPAAGQEEEPHYLRGRSCVAIVSSPIFFPMSLPTSVEKR